MAAGRAQRCAGGRRSGRNGTGSSVITSYATIAGAIHNLVFLLGLAFIVSSALRYLRRLPPRVFPLAIGLAFGAVAVGTMAVSFRIADGIYGDLRNVVIVGAGVFGGPLAAFVAAASAAIYRLLLGGFVGGALLGIASSALLGATFHWLWVRPGKPRPLAAYIALGVLLAIVNAAMPLIVGFPDPAQWQVSIDLATLILPVALVVYPLALLLLCHFIDAELRRLAAEQGLSRSNAGLIERSSELEVANRAFAREVLDHIETEQALRDSETRLREAQRQARLGHWSWSIGENRIEHRSDEIDRMLGVVEQEPAPGYDWYMALVHPADRAAVRAVYQAADAGPADYETEHRVVRADGAIAWIQEIGRVERDEQGRPRRFLGTMQDVTERRNADEALRHSTARLRRAQQLANVAHWIWYPGRTDWKWDDDAGSFGHAAVDMFGPSAKDLGITGEAYLDRFAHPDDAVELRGILAQLVAGEIDTCVIEYRMKHPGTGAWIMVREAAENVRAQDGSLLYTMGSIQDVTERSHADDALRRSEALLQRAQHMARLGHWIWRPDPGVLDWRGGVSEYSRAAAAIFGVPPSALAIGSEAFLERYVHPDDRQVAQQAFANLAGPNEANYSAEYRIVRPDGEIRTVFEIAENVFAADGKLLHTMGTVQDITERKRGEEALRQSESLLRRAQQMAKLCHWMWRPDSDRSWFGGVTQSSEAAAGIFGVPVAELAVSNDAFIDRFVHPDDRERVRCSYQAKIDAGVINYAAAYRIVDSQGRVRYVQEASECTLEESGAPLYSLGIIQDVTEQRLSEAALAESQALLRAVVDAVPATLNVKDRDGRYVLANAYQAHYHHLTPDWFPGRNPAELYSQTYAEEIRRRDREVIASGRDSGFRESPYAEADGRVTTWLGSRSPILDESGAVKYVVSVGLDITDRKRAEAALRESQALMRAVVDSVPAVINVKDLDGRYVLVNAFMAEQVGQPAEWFTGRSPAEIYRPDYVDALRAREQQVIDSGERLGFFEDEFIEPDGSRSWWFACKSPLLDADGRVKYLVSVGLDITERKRAAEALAENRTLLRAIIDTVPATINVKDRDGRYVLLNAYQAAWHGKPVDWFPGRSPEDVYVDVDYARRIRETDRQVIASGSGTGFHEIEYPEPSGGKSQWLMSRAPIFDESGNVRHIVAVGLDISDRKRIEQQLRESEGLLRRAQRIARLGHYVLVPSVGAAEARDYECRYSPGVADILGVGLEELAVTDREFVGRFVHPEDRARLMATHEQFVDALSASGRAPSDHRAEYRILRSDGEVRTIFEVVENVDAEDGSLRYIMGTMQDITERKRAEAVLRESERRFRSLADSIPALIWMSDVNGGCIFVNRRWTEHTGRSLDQELGRGFEDNIHPEDLERTLPQEAATFAERRLHSEEYRLRGRDGEYRWFLDTMVPRFSAADEYLGHVGVLIDIDERRRLEEQLRQSQKMEAVGQLTGGVAHDFNNLLTVVIGNLERIQEHRDDPRKVDALAVMAFQAAQRGAELVQRLLAFSRKQTLMPTDIQPNRLVAGLTDLLRRTLGESIEVALRLSDSAWPATADPAQLENALLNLAINARDAMSGGGRLLIETGNAILDAADVAQIPEAVAGSYVLLTVSDNGAGMTPDVLERACQPFFTTKEVGKGTGLGLSMVYGFAKQSGGHLKIESEVGRGTTVKLYLTRARGANVAAGQPATAEMPGGGETILVVEDNEHVCRFVAAQLGGLGYAVIAATTGEAALDLIESGRPIDLLFSDVMLPGSFNGPRLLQEARRRRPELKALFTSGYAADALLHRQLHEGGVRLLRKPYRHHDLAHHVRTALDAEAA